MRPAKHRGWKYARLACGRFTRPCGFPSPAIHCLSAENLELPLSFGLTVALFRQSRELESITYFILNLIYGITYHLVCDFGIDLCCGRVFMSQHLRNRFQRNTVHQSNRRGERVPRHMEFQILGDSALSGNMFQTGVRGFQRSDRKNLTWIIREQRIMPILHYSVLFKNRFCDRKKSYRKRDLSLLPGTANPPFSVRGLF